MFRSSRNLSLLVTSTRSGQAIRVRPDAEKNERYRYLQLPDGPLRCAPGDAATTRRPRPRCAALPQRHQRPAWPLPRRLSASGTPHFSPHRLRRRRGSLHYKRTSSLAEVAQLLGDSGPRASTITSTRSSTIARSSRAGHPDASSARSDVPPRACTGACTAASELLICRGFLHQLAHQSPTRRGVWLSASRLLRPGRGHRTAPVHAGLGGMSSTTAAEPSSRSSSMSSTNACGLPKRVSDRDPRQ